MPSAYRMKDEERSQDSSGLGSIHLYFFSLSPSLSRVHIYPSQELSSFPLYNPFFSNTFLLPLPLYIAADYHTRRERMHTLILGIVTNWYRLSVGNKGLIQLTELEKRRSATAATRNRRKLIDMVNFPLITDRGT